MFDLTIAIPTFNRSQYLMGALNAIVEDSFGIVEHIEVVVSDNASEDDTMKIVQSFDGLKIRYFRNDSNVGAFENILLACERSTGSYVMLHSDDDLLYPGVLRRLIEIIRANPKVGVISGPVESLESGSYPSLVKLRFAGGSTDLRLDLGADAFSKLFLRTTFISGLVIRRDMLDIIGAREYAASLYPQMYLVCNAAKKSDAVYFSKPVMRTRNNPIRHWNYTHDFMAGAVLEILKDLTRDELWGDDVRKIITRKRILATYGPLYCSRAHLWKTFIQTVRGFASVPEYRRSGLFWLLVLGIGLLGTRGINGIRKIWRGPIIDSVD